MTVVSARGAVAGTPTTVPPRTCLACASCSRWRHRGPQSAREPSCTKRSRLTTTGSATRTTVSCRGWRSVRSRSRGLGTSSRIGRSARRTCSSSTTWRTRPQRRPCLCPLRQRSSADCWLSRSGSCWSGTASKSSRQPTTLLRSTTRKTTPPLCRDPRQQHQHLLLRWLRDELTNPQDAPSPTPPHLPHQANTPPCLSQAHHLGPDSCAGRTPVPCVCGCASLPAWPFGAVAVGRIGIRSGAASSLQPPYTKQEEKAKCRRGWLSQTLGELNKVQPQEV